MKSAATGNASRNLAIKNTWRQIGWITLILLVAAALRLINLSGAPPGMTHDEADHGLTAWSIVNGARDIYFTVGYGREPLYDYATALVMAGTGPAIFAARLTSAYLSLIMIAAVYAWARVAFGRRVALFAATGLALGFWPVMAGRQALRSIALPAILSLAVLFFWHGLLRIYPQERRISEKQGNASKYLIPFFISGVFLGLSLYTYIPARVLWLLLPASALFVILIAGKQGHVRRLIVGSGLTLIVAAAVAAPLFLYLAGHPGLEVRIDELSAPLQAARAGEFAPLWANMRGALRLFTFAGDDAWRYNIPGKPFLDPVMGLLFYAGLAAAVWSAARGLWRRGAPTSALLPPRPLSPASCFLALAWLALGFSPVLVTGPGLSMTQAIGMSPMLYIFPAITLAVGYDSLERPRLIRRTLNPAAVTILFLFIATGVLTVRDYFVHWTNEPQVRVQYETTMVTALRYLDLHGRGPASISTITPGRFHTPAVASLTLHNPAVAPRYFDGRQSLILPGEPGGLLVVPGFTPIPDELLRYLTEARLIEELPMRPDDLDRPVRIYRLGSSGQDLIRSSARMTMLPTTTGEANPVDFHNIALLGYDLSATEARPGDTLTLITAWQLEQPLPDASLFAHLVGPDGTLAVADGLGAPGEGWVAGDVLLQRHVVAIPADAPPGTWSLVVGVYNQSSEQRLTTDSGEDVVKLVSVMVIDE